MDPMSTMALVLPMGTDCEMHISHSRTNAVAPGKGSYHMAKHAGHRSAPRIHSWHVSTQSLETRGRDPCPTAQRFDVSEGGWKSAVVVASLSSWKIRMTYQACVGRCRKRGSETGEAGPTGQRPCIEGSSISRQKELNLEGRSLKSAGTIGTMGTMGTMGGWDGWDDWVSQSGVGEAAICSAMPF